MQLTGTAPPSGSVQPKMATRSVFTETAGPKWIFTRRCKTNGSESSKVSITLMPIGSSLSSCQPRSCKWILRTENISGPEGAEELVDESDSDDEVTSTGGDSDTVQTPDDGRPWCPPLPEAPEDPTEEELAGAAEKLEAMVEQQKSKPEIFFSLLLPLSSGCGVARQIWGALLMGYLIG